MDIIYPDAPAQNGLIFDTHAHFDDKRFDGFRDRLLNVLPDMGVGGVINCAVDGASAKSVTELAEKYDFCYSAVGFHPENLNGALPELSEITCFLKHKKTVAVGEIGLDYYWDKSNAMLQKEAFISQISLAKELNLPIIIHDRDAHLDTLDIIKQYRPTGVVHCFSGSAETAREIIACGMYIGIGGVATFKNAKALPHVIEETPIDRILLETDAPYMAPEPYRGKCNHSGLIIRVAEKISDIKKIPVEDILKITKRNAETLFNI